MDDRIDANRKLWNALTAAHVTSEFYDVAGFKAGKECLDDIVLGEMGEVTGKALLHLQCHFGLDTLAWARHGAVVTGVDISEDAIAFARWLAAETELAAEFVHSDVLALPQVLHDRYDIVFTSYGALGWLPDLRAWADVVARFLRPGGVFYMAEIHPVLEMFYNEDNFGDSSGLRVRGSYFPAGTSVYHGGYDYASDFTHDLTSYEWQHPLGEVVTALVRAGLRIDCLHEFPLCCFKALPEMTQGADGLWRLPGDKVPLIYTVRAVKPAA